MSPRPPCTFSVATAVIVITVGNIITAEASPSVPTEVIQNLRQVSEAIQELTAAIAGRQSCKFVQTVAEPLQSQQPVLVQLLSKSVGNQNPQCQAYVGTEYASNKGSCRSPFYKVGGDCLFVQSDVQHTWENARKFCRSFGGDLVVPSDVLKLKELLTNFRDRSFWIGGVDIGDNNNKWQWLNGSLVDLSVGWSRYQPDKLKGENCIHYWHLSNWLLNDNVCSVMMNFVCQDAVHVL
ncbi:perlucin-like protein [Oratosquilla oratoria]|uniref:perlucin-like protein n=1 Tax=Oratosquilla oratoria TaxID=337810 RepID=UPI003F773FF7